MILRSWAFVASVHIAPRAIHVRLAHRHQCTCSTVFIVRSGTCVLVDKAAEPLGDLSVRLTRGVLVDQCGSHVVVAHPSHQVLGCRTRPRGQVVAGMPQVVEVQTRNAKLSDRLDPAREVC